MRSKLLIPAVGLSLLLNSGQLNARMNNFKSMPDKRDAVSKTIPAGNSKTFAAPASIDFLQNRSVPPVWSKAPVDSLYLELMRAVFIDEISKIRLENGQTPVVAERHFTRQAQKYADTLAPLQDDQISHDATEQAERLSWLLPFAKSVRECIHRGSVFTSLSDTTAVLQEIRQAARLLMASPEHAKAILNLSPGHGLGGAGIVFCKTQNSDSYRLIIIYTRGCYPIQPPTAEVSSRP